MVKDRFKRGSRRCFTSSIRIVAAIKVYGRKAYRTIDSVENRLNSVEQTLTEKIDKVDMKLSILTMI